MFSLIRKQLLFPYCKFTNDAVSLNKQTKYDFAS